MGCRKGSWPLGGAVANEKCGIGSVGQLERSSNMESVTSEEREMMVGWAGWLFVGQCCRVKKELQIRSVALKVWMHP